jgi:hypothetical protein
MSHRAAALVLIGDEPLTNTLSRPQISVSVSREPKRYPLRPWHPDQRAPREYIAGDRHSDYASYPSGYPPDLTIPPVQLVPTWYTTRFIVLPAFKVTQQIWCDLRSFRRCSDI